MRHTALIIVDLQRDFCEGGSLPVQGGNALAVRLTEFLHLSKSEFDIVCASMDFHIAPISHFSKEPDYEKTWPPHCVVGTSGVELHPDLDINYIDFFFRKGFYTASYSAFNGINYDYEGLHTLLQRHNIQAVEICGIATDYCVLQTALDAKGLGYRVKLLSDFSVGVSEDGTAAAIEKMKQAGIKVI